MILHLVFDDKFADYAVQQFLPLGNSEFISVVSSTEQEFTHIKQIEKIRVLLDGSYDYCQLLDSLYRYSSIIIHGFYTPWQVDIIKHAPSEVKVCWAFWGGDMYQRPDIRDSYLSKSSLILQKTRTFIKGKEEEGYIIPFDVFQRIDYLLDDSYENYEDVKRYIRKPDLKYLWYTYYSIEETVGENLKQASVDGEDIMVGHTAGIRTNHINGFYAVKRLDLKGHQVLSAMSYGAPWYRNLMLRTGKILFGDKFNPLLTFMPLEQYNNILRACSVDVMPAYKPEGMGNCLTALWLGARLYMYERNLQYQYFKRLGLSVFSINKDLRRSNKNWADPLSDTEIENNRKILMKHYGKESMKQKIRLIVDTLES